MSARFHHVSIPRPPDSDHETRTFYGNLLRLEELEVPESIRHLGLIWFRLGPGMELHCFEEQPVGDRSSRHFCLHLDDLPDVRRRLEAAGYEPWDPIPIPGRPRFFCRDPFDNIVEYTSIEPTG